MKTREEIKRMGENFATKHEDVSDKLGKYLVNACFQDGYIQCQKDMVDTIKKAIEFGYQLRNNNKPINSGIDWVNEFNSLNKQDNEN